MQMVNRANGKGRSTSPLDGNTSSSLPLVPLHNQLGNLSLSKTPAKTRVPSASSNTINHARSRSTVVAGQSASLSRPSTSASPAKASRHKPSKSVSDAPKSAKTSPVKPVRSGHASMSKTPNRAAGSLSRSTAGQAVKDTVAAGGLGRMDIAGKDWDARSSSNGSAGNSPQKKKLAASVKVCSTLPNQHQY